MSCYFYLVPALLFLSPSIYFLMSQLFQPSPESSPFSVGRQTKTPECWGRVEKEVLLMGTAEEGKCGTWRPFPLQAGSQLQLSCDHERPCSRHGQVSTCCSKAMAWNQHWPRG